MRFRTFTTVGELLWYYCSPDCGLPTWWVWDLILSRLYPSYHLLAASSLSFWTWGFFFFFGGFQWGFPCSSVGKGSACSGGDPSSIPGLGISPGEGNGNPLQYPCLQNSMDRGYSPWSWKESGMTEWQTLLIGSSGIIWRLWQYMKRIWGSSYVCPLFQHLLHFSVVILFQSLSSSSSGQLEIL